MPYLDQHGASPRGEVTRERVLHAALDVFTRHGYEGATMRMIAQRLGVKDPALYHYFSSKRAILEAILGGDWEIRLPAGADALPIVDSCEGVPALVDAVLTGLADHEDFVRLVARQSLLGESAREIRKARSAAWAEFIATHFSEEIPEEGRRKLTQSLGYFTAGILFMSQQRYRGGLREALGDEAFVARMHRLAQVAIPVGRFLPPYRRTH